MIENQMIENAKINDIEKIVELHIEGLPQLFLSKLGPAFLRQMYRGILSEAVLLVARDNVVARDGDEIIGFIAGTDDTRKMFRRIIRKRFFQMSLAVLPKLIRKPGLAMEIIEYMRYPSMGKLTKNKPTKNKPPTGKPSELLMISVRKNHRRGGTGAKLVAALNKKLPGNLGVVVDPEISGAEPFYTSLGFKKQAEVFLGSRKINYFILS